MLKKIFCLPALFVCCANLYAGEVNVDDNAKLFFEEESEEVVACDRCGGRILIAAEENDSEASELLVFDDESNGDADATLAFDDESNGDADANLAFDDEETGSELLAYDDEDSSSFMDEEEALVISDEEENPLFFDSEETTLAKSKGCPCDKEHLA